MGMCPRYLNPDKGLFWACVYVIDYIYQATFYGGGFSTDEGVNEETKDGGEDREGRDTETITRDENNFV